MTFGRSGLIRGITFGRSGLKIGITFGRSGLKIGMAFGRSGLIKSNTNSNVYIYDLFVPNMDCKSRQKRQERSKSPVLDS
jgi:hypothetical protein